MYKAFALFGFASVLFLSQGCGGKKEVAAVPPHLSQPSGAPSAANTGTGESTGYNPNPPTGKLGPPDDGGDGYEQQQSQGQPGGAPMPAEMGYGGPSGQQGYGGPQSGSGQGYGGPQSGNGQGYGGPQGYSSGGGDQSFGLNDGQGGYQPNGNFQGAPGRNQNRPKPKPLTLKEQSIVSFQAGNPKRAYALMQAHALQVADEEAVESLNEYRWASHRKRPQLGVTVAVGVTLKNTSNSSDLSPIGVEPRNGSGGGMEYGMSPNGMGGANANASKTKSFAETTGAFGASLASAFKESHSKGSWAPAFKEISLSNGRPTGFGGSNGGFGGGFGEGSEASFSGGPQTAGFQENNGNQNSGYPSGYGQQQQSGNGGYGGDAYSNMGGAPAGYPDGRGNPGGDYPTMATGYGPGAPPTEASGPNESSPGPGLKGKGGTMSSPLKFLQGKGGFGAVGAGIDEGSGGGYGGPAGFGGQFGGPGGQDGFGGPNGQSPAFGANSKLPPGSTPIAPCLVYIGVDESAKLIKKAAQDGYDALIIFDVKVGLNRVLGKVTNDTFVSVVQPNLVPKEVKRIYSSKVLNNLQAAKSKAKGDSDGVDEVVERIIKGTEEALALQAIPAVLTPEIIMNKRVPALVKDTESSVIERLSEVNLYYSKGLIDDSQKAEAFAQIDGALGRVIATGSPSEKLAALEKLLDREFK